MLGGLAAVGAAFLWAGSISLYRAFGQSITADQLNLFKNLVALSILGAAAVIWQSPFPEASTTRDLMISGLLGIAIGDTLLFESLKRLGAQLASAMQCLVPVLTAALGLLFLGETLNLAQTIGLVVTTVSIAAVVWFSARVKSVTPRFVGLFLGVLSSSVQSVGIVWARHALPEAGVLMGTLLRLVPAVLFLIPLASLSILRGRDRAWIPPRKDLPGLLLGAFMGGVLGLLLFTAAIKFTKAGVAAALSMSYPVWVIPIARFWLHEKVTWQSAVATVAAVVGIIVLMTG